jgi:hypothetical protein
MAMITGLRPETFEHIQLNAGAFLMNFDYSKATDAKTLREAIATAIRGAQTTVLSATRGGGTFSMTPATRGIEADGKRMEFVGSTINDGYTAQMTGTFLEFTEKTFRALGGVISETSTATLKEIRFPTSFANNMYITSLVWVGDMGNDRVLLIDLSNALNTSGVSFTFTDKGEGTMPFTFVAHQADLDDSEFAPIKVRIYSNT